MFTKSNKKLLLLVSLLIATSITTAQDNRNHKKRQIYREQVLPHAGGRIPDTAFETDRLFLNRLQKEGIAVPDGVVLEQRNPQVYPFYNKDQRTVFHIAHSSDARFISKEGRYQYNELPTIETTYLYPQIHGQKFTTKPVTPAFPVYRQFQLHNTQLNQIKLQPKKKAQNYHITADTSKEQLKPLKSTSYQNFNIIHDALNRPLISPAATNFVNAPGTGPEPAFFDNTAKQYLPSYNSESIFNEFNHYFNNFDLYQTTGHTIDLPAADFSSNSDQILY